MSADRYWELASTWLRSAEADLSFAEVGLREGYSVQVCFNCQQVAQKSLKAYLSGQRQQLIRTHVLPRLLQDCIRFDAGFAEVAGACAILNAYYTDTRYPGSVNALSFYDARVAQEAVQLARQVLARVRESIAPLLGGEA